MNTFALIYVVCFYEVTYLWLLPSTGVIQGSILAYLNVTTVEYDHLKNFQHVSRSTVVPLDWAGLKWRPVLKVWKQLQDKHSQVMQNSYR